MLEQFFIPIIIALAFIIIIWFFWGREKLGTIIPLYEPPKDMGVLECGILLDDSVNTKDITLELFNLYTQGILIRKENDSLALNPGLDNQNIEMLTTGQAVLLKNLIGKDYDIYIGEKTYKDDLKKFSEKNSQHFTQGHLDFLYKSKLQDFSKRINEVKFEMYDLMTGNGYFPTSPFDQRKPFFTIGAVLFAGPLLLMISSVFGHGSSLFQHLFTWPLVFGLCFSGIIIAYASLLMVKKTTKGVKAKADFLGLKVYIQTAEIDRIKFVIKNNITAYKKLLPYAALFNSLDRWIEPLKSMNTALEMAEFQNIENTLSGMNVDLSITEPQHWKRALKDLFVYGAAIVGKSRRRF